MSNVVNFNGVTSLDLPVERVIEGAMKAGLKSIVITGEREDGSEYFASSLASGPETLWMLARMQKILLETVD